MERVKAVEGKVAAAKAKGFIPQALQDELDAAQQEADEMDEVWS